MEEIFFGVTLGLASGLSPGPLLRVLGAVLGVTGLQDLGLL